MNLISNQYKSYLITGGTGSFGSKMIQKLLKSKSPKRVICFSRDELKQFDLSSVIKDKRLRLFIGDIRDKTRLLEAFRDVDVVIHAAAMKQVPASEYNPTECIKTNIIGAENIIEAAIERKVKKVIALSTDKAVSPINLYGATKLAADKLFIAANGYTGSSKISFSTVRYGNVLNSRGSVIPFFLKLKNNKSKTLPITHKEMTRFVLSLEDGVNFVLKSLKLMRGGEIFIPKLPSMKIFDLAEAINPQAKKEIIGIRPGEKIHEVLCPKDESSNVIEFKNYYIIKPSISFAKKVNFLKSSENEIGKEVDENFEYNSLNNTNYLSIPKLIKIVQNICNNPN